MKPFGARRIAILATTFIAATALTTAAQAQDPSTEWKAEDTVINKELGN